MKPVYKLVGKKVLELEGDKEVHAFDSLHEFLIDEMELDQSLSNIFETSCDDLSNLMDSTTLEESIATYVCSHFEEIFKGNSDTLSEMAFKKEEKSLERKFKEFGKELYNKTKESLESNIKTLLGNKTANGGNMFKTIKEAKTFTAHLDALANEIESLDGVSGEMKKHLAYRLDRLSDLIETSSFQTEKKANGIGAGAWAQDSDEKYMNTFGGTGVLVGDSDESSYMKEFKGDDHQEVLNRKEPAGKVKQPSDNYNEGEVAKKLRSTIKSIMAELK